MPRVAAPGVPPRARACCLWAQSHRPPVTSLPVPQARRHGSCGFSPQKVGFPKEIMFSSDLEPARLLCAPHAGTGRSLPSRCTGQALRPGHRGTLKHPGELATGRGGYRKMQAQELDAGTIPPPATCLKHQLGEALVLRLPQAPARRTPGALLPFPVSHPPASALPLAMGSRRG